jgi:hypothetical protein
MFVLVVVGSAAQPTTPSSMKAPTFLTRDGCVNSSDMVLNLDDALKALGWPKDYRYIDISKLPKTDVADGLSDTDLLYHGKDLFGMPIPAAPPDYPQLSCDA